MELTSLPTHFYFLLHIHISLKVPWNYYGTEYLDKESVRRNLFLCLGKWLSNQIQALYVMNRWGYYRFPSVLKLYTIAQVTECMFSVFHTMEIFFQGKSNYF